MKTCIHHFISLISAFLLYCLFCGHSQSCMFDFGLENKSTSTTDFWSGVQSNWNGSSVAFWSSSFKFPPIMTKSNVKKGWVICVVPVVAELFIDSYEDKTSFRTRRKNFSKLPPDVSQTSLDFCCTLNMRNKVQCPICWRTRRGIIDWFLWALSVTVTLQWMICRCWMDITVLVWLVI